MSEVTKIKNDIKSGNIKPVYFFSGEEPYFIDELTDFMEQNLLSEEEKGFNQTVLYGRDVSIGDIVDTAMRFPMMAERQVIIVREAQDLKSLDKLDNYVEKPQITTVLVFAYKYKKLDTRTKAVQVLQKKAVFFESKKLYDNKVGEWIKQTLSEQSYNIEPKASAMLLEFLGNDLSKINNELNKLKIILPKGHTITAGDIERNIGISKDYNVFELRKAIGERNQLKAYKIIEYFAQNPKENPIVVTTGQFFSFFLQLFQYHGLKDKSKANIAKILKVNPYFVSDYEIAARNYPMKKVSAVVAKLRDIDVKSKGVGANSIPDYDLMKEMLVHIFN